MHYVQIPHDIQVKDRKTGTVTPLSFVTYANLIWLDDTRWETPKANLARLMRVVAEIDRAAPGEWMLLEDQDWLILKDIIEKPGMRGDVPTLLTPLVQIQVGPTFEGAILDAPTKDPREVIAPPPNGAGAAKEEATS